MANDRERERALIQPHDQLETLETKNARLYQDNCKLVHVVNTLNERLAFLGASPNVQAFHFSVMQEKLRVSDESHASVHRKYQDLLRSVSAGSAHHHVYMELQAARDAYASLEREYRILREKYVWLKGVVDTTHVPQQSQHPAPPLVPLVPSDRRLPNQASPASFQPVPDRKGIHQRRSSDGAVAQPPLTTWLAPLPTPPPSATSPGGQISPRPFPVHTTVPARSLTLPFHAQATQDPYTSSGLSATHQSPVQHKAAIHLQRCEQVIDMTCNEPPQRGSPEPLESSLRSSKRSNADLQTSVDQGGERKKPRTEGEDAHPITVDTHPVDTVVSTLASTDNHNVSESDPDLRSDQECVNLIFEKDADVEDGVFCGLCFNRYQAGMISEPPEVLIQPDFDLLLMHCMAMHPSVWDDLHRKT